MEGKGSTSGASRRESRPDEAMEAADAVNRDVLERKHGGRGGGGGGGGSGVTTLPAVLRRLKRGIIRLIEGLDRARKSRTYNPGAELDRTEE
jgi:hypothetical protein